MTLIQFELLNVFHLGHSYEYHYFLSLSPNHTYYHTEHMCHVCIQRLQPTLYVHVQHFVSCRQAGTTAVPGFKTTLDGGSGTQSQHGLQKRCVCVSCTSLFEF